MVPVALLEVKNSRLRIRIVYLEQLVEGIPVIDIIIL